MKDIPLTQGQVAVVDNDDYATLSQHKWYAKWNKCTQSFYAARQGARQNGKQKTIYMHSFIIGRQADHKNHDTLDNRKSNLRPAGSRNQQNRRVNSNNKSGYKGVSLDRGRWRAQIKYEGRVRNLGRFDDKISAARVYDAAARELFGEFAFINFPEAKKQ